LYSLLSSFILPSRSSSFPGHLLPRGYFFEELRLFSFFTSFPGLAHSFPLYPPLLFLPLALFSTHRAFRRAKCRPLYSLSHLFKLSSPFHPPPSLSFPLPHKRCLGFSVPPRFLLTSAVSFRFFFLIRKESAVAGILTGRCPPFLPFEVASAFLATRSYFFFTGFFFSFA